MSRAAVAHALVMLWCCASVHAQTRVRYVSRAGGEFTLRLSAGQLQMRSGTVPLWTFRASTSEFLAGAASDTAAPQPCPGDEPFSLLEDDLDRDGAIDATAGERRDVVFAAPTQAAQQGDPSPAAVRLFALDISDPQHPRVRWSLGPQDLPGLILHAPSVPLVARIRTSANGRRDPRDFVVMVATGATEAVAGGVTGLPRIFMLDASSGRRLWSAARVAGDLPLAQLDFGFTAAFTALDLDADQYADRLYAADAGGQLWRFDIWHASEPRALVTGGVVARLLDGTARSAGVTVVASPDVALLRSSREGSWFNIAVGTAQRAGTPASLHGWLFTVHDREPFERWSQARYDSARPLDARDLATVVPGTAAAAPGTSGAGWKLALPMGAEVRTDTLTAAGTLLVQTFSPVTGGVQRCEIGANQMLAVTIDAAAPALDLNADGHVDAADTWVTLHPGAPSPAVQLSLVSRGGDAPDQLCVGGIRGACIVSPRWLRTYWTRADAQ